MSPYQRALVTGQLDDKTHEVAPNPAKQDPVRFALQGSTAVPRPWDEVEEDPQNPQVRAEGVDGAVHFPEHRAQEEGHI